MKAFAYEDGSACGYYRLRVPFYEMHLNGIDVGYATGGPFPQDADVVVGQRVGSDSQSLPLLKIWRHRALVWETDDDLWNIDPTNLRAARAYNPQFLAEIADTVRMADMVTTSTNYLAEQMSKFSRNVVVLPNCVEHGLFEVERPRREKVTVGWAGGDSHARDLGSVAPLLRRFFRRNPHVDLHVIGWGSGKRVADFPAHMRPFLQPNPLQEMGVEHRYTPWSAEIWDYYAGIDFDIGIAPLIPNEFNRSKSAIKALEYAALGIPVIASDVEPYREFVVDGVTGFLVKREHEWEARLRDLANDEAMRLEMGAKAKEHALGWSIRNRWHEWVAAYESLLGVSWARRSTSTASALSPSTGAPLLTR